MVTGEDFLHCFLFLPLSLFFCSPSFFPCLISSRGHLEWGQNLWSPRGSFLWVGGIQAKLRSQPSCAGKGDQAAPGEQPEWQVTVSTQFLLPIPGRLLVAWTCSVKFFRNCTLILVFHPLFPSLTLVPFSLASLTMAFISPFCVWPTKFSKGHLLQCGWEKSANQLVCGYTM